MSRWIKTVNNLLDRVDGRVGEQIVASNHDDDVDEDDDETVDHSSVENEEVDSNNALSDDEEMDFQAHNVHTDDTSLPPKGEKLAHEESETEETADQSYELECQPKGGSEDNFEVSSEIKSEDDDVVVVHGEKITSTENNLDFTSMNFKADAPPTSLQMGFSQSEVSRMIDDAIRKANEDVAENLRVQTQLAQQATRDAKEAKKESKKLRRKLTEINSELESAEQEMAAQRTELERAGQRMERDRVRHKEELDRKDKEHQETVSAITLEHQSAIKAMSASHVEQVNEMQERLQRNEQARAKEGGDWQGELEQAVQREQESLKKVILLEDEKSTLLSQLSTLQTTINSLQSRVDSLAISANTASEREKDAEDRLDAALSLHARQLTQRQMREVELERSVADLGAALVVSRQREHDRSSRGDGSASRSAKGESSDEKKSPGSQLATIQEELDILKAQLALERQHSATLHQELCDVANERSEEALATIAKQRKHDRQVAELTANVMTLKNLLREKEQLALKRNSQGWMEADNEEITQLRQHISSLSEQVLRQQSRIDNLSSENSALKSRLNSAVSRAEQAESTLMTVSESAAKLDSDRLVAPPLVVGRGRRRVRMPASAGSIRAAFNIPHGRSGDRREQFGQFIDALDKWSLETGAMLRQNPFARGGFLLYLCVLHLWTFALLMFHAHSFDHRDFSYEHGVSGMLRGSAAAVNQPVKGMLRGAVVAGTQP
mmetsp:Transcript_28181/g.40357  ORF Transcript_28181/g.40357 Transcript_28181/m.40357 type:complete len:727 (+) Transcript_28181:76-2256(+)